MSSEAAPYAFVTFLMRNDSYLPGALMLADALRRQSAADRVCLVTPEISAAARGALRALFDHVVDVPAIYCPHARRQQRQDRPYMFTRLHALRLGADGDLGLAYRKVILLDADVLPLRGYDRLWALEPPAGIINERKSHLVQVAADGRYVVPSSVHVDGTWHWHRIYARCPHGTRIPRAITDRVREDPTNLGICGCLFVLEPSMAEFRRIRQDIARPVVARLVGDVYDWPDMQYMTLRWSGRWTNVDLRYGAHCGYPDLAVLYGTHYAGLKPWQVEHASLRCYARHDDFALWYREYASLMARFPALRRVKRLDRLLGQARLMAARPGSSSKAPAPAPTAAYSCRPDRRRSRRRAQ